MQSSVLRGLRTIGRRLSGVAAVLLLLFVLASPAQAETIRVAYIPADGYITKEADGTMEGAVYEYMEMLAGYAGVQFEYIPGTVMECRERVLTGKADLLINTIQGHFLKTGQDLVSSKISMSHIPVYLGVHDGAGRPWRVGFSDSLLDMDHVKRFMTRAGYEPGDYELLPMSWPQLHADYAAGRIDGFIGTANVEQIGSDYRAPLYLGDSVMQARPEKQALLDRLDFAANMMAMDNPSFVEELYTQNVWERIPLWLRMENQAYLRTLSSIKVLVRSDLPPYSYMENGEYKGILADIAKHLQKDLGVPFEYVPCSSSKELFDKFQAGDGDLILAFNADPNWAFKKGAYLTFSYMNASYVGIRRRNDTLPEHPVVATTKGEHYMEHDISRLYGKGSIRRYDTEQDCLEAVRDGKADITFMKSFLAQPRLDAGGFYDLYPDGIEAFRHGLAIAVRKSTDKRLYMSLNRVIRNLPRSQVESIVLDNTMSAVGPKTLSGYAYRYPYAVAAILILIFGVLVGTFLIMLRSRRRLRRQLWNDRYTDFLTGEKSLRWMRDYMQSVPDSFVQAWKEGRIAVLICRLQRMEVLREVFEWESLVKSLLQQVDAFSKDYDWIKVRAVDSEANRFVAIAVLPSGTDPKEFAQIFSENMQYIEIGHMKTQIRLRIGVRQLPAGQKFTGQQMLDNVTIAMDEASEAGEDIGVYDAAMHERVTQQQQMERLAHKAIEHREFKLYLQPKYDIASHGLVGAETLVRWQSPELGFLNPYAFIDLFERNGFIIELDYYMLESILAFQKARIAAGEPIFPISVNQSGLHMQEFGYLDRMQELAAKYQLPKGAVELEITETAFIDFATKERRTNAQDIIQDLKAMGYSLSMDDFCTGYSSIAMLECLPMDVMKIDRSMLLAAERNSRAKNILAHVVDLGKSLSMKVITEGVETPEQESLLLSVGCKSGQGYLFGKPMPEEEFLKFLKEHPVQESARIQ